MVRYCVIMTACIDPSKGRIKVHRSDPAVRLGDYLEGLRFWLELNDERVSDIVFVENSGHSLEALRNLAQSPNYRSKTVEFISLPDNDYPADAHYGYAELRMVDQAFDVSELLQRSTHFIKATGRLSFPDISRLLHRLPSGFVCAVDSRSNALFCRVPQIFVSTQLMIFSIPFYRATLYGARNELGGAESHIENLFYRKLMPYKGTDGAILRWPVNVSPRGVAAHWEKNYGSRKQKAIDAARAILRIAIPNWWI
jgi:hypothetical protein